MVGGAMQSSGSGGFQHVVASKFHIGSGLE